MYTFGRIENVPFLLDDVDALEAAVPYEPDAQNTEAARIAAELQADIDASKNEVVPHDEVITAEPAKGAKGVAAVREEGRERREELRRKLADAKHELAVIESTILVLPYEVMAEIFNWHMLMGGNLRTMLLVCTGWTTVAYSSPRLWSRIAVTDRSPDQLRLQGLSDVTPWASCSVPSLVAVRVLFKSRFPSIAMCFQPMVTHDPLRSAGGIKLMTIAAKLSHLSSIIRY